MGTPRSFPGVAHFAREGLTGSSSSAGEQPKDVMMPGRNRPSKYFHENDDGTSTPAPTPTPTCGTCQHHRQVVGFQLEDTMPEVTLMTAAFEGEPLGRPYWCPASVLPKLEAGMVQGFRKR